MAEVAPCNRCKDNPGAPLDAAVIGAGVALMRTAIECADAEGGLLILPEGMNERVAAEATAAGDAVEVHSLEEPGAETARPLSIVHHVVRTGAQMRNTFESDFEGTRWRVNSPSRTGRLCFVVCVTKPGRANPHATEGQEIG